MEKQSISDWVAITKNQKSGWSQFYRAMTGTPLSDIPRFLKAVDDFGHMTMFEAVLAASTRKLTGDPLNYVIGIALNKTRETLQELEENELYKMRLEKSKQRVQRQNEELEERIRKAKEHG
jgi:DNA-binding transcriptional MerR regulator